MRRHPAPSTGLTLIELLISTFITLLALAAILGSYMSNIQLTNVASNRVAYQIAVNDYIELLRRPSFFETLLGCAVTSGRHLAGDVANEPAFTLPPGAPAGSGELLVQYENKTAGSINYVQVTLVPIWREGQNRVIGEDLNLDGTPDAGEDTNSSGVLDSPYQITVIIAKRNT